MSPVVTSMVCEGQFEKGIFLKQHVTTTVFSIWQSQKTAQMLDFVLGAVTGTEVVLCPVQWHFDYE